jgi:hypothetical protein
MVVLVFEPFLIETMGKGFYIFFERSETMISKAFARLQRCETFTASVEALRACRQAGRGELALDTALHIQDLVAQGEQWARQRLDSLDDVDEPTAIELYELALLVEILVVLQACLSCAAWDNEAGPFYKLDGDTFLRLEVLLENIEQLSGRDWVGAPLFYPGWSRPARVLLTGEVGDGRHTAAGP